jgi:hypothetical protein
MTKTANEMANHLVKQFTFNCRECDNAILSAQFAVDEMYWMISQMPCDKTQELNYLLDVEEEIKKLYESNSN